MKTVFTSNRAELTDQLTSHITAGYACFRIRTACLCRTRFKHPERNISANQRNGVLIIKRNKVVKKLIKCKRCSKNASQHDKNRFLNWFHLL